MSEPTKEQVKWLLERCGFRYIKQEEIVKNVIMPYGHWIDPEGNPIPDGIMLLPIDLNNLFKYAVPKLTQGTGHPYSITLVAQWGECSDDYGVEIKNPTLYGRKRLALKFDRNPALALFWAIWEVIKNE